MDILARNIADSLGSASWIRRMFEAGAQLKAQYGAENVYDFSLGNPDLPAPPEAVQGLKDFAATCTEPFAFGYMANGGFPWLRKDVAAWLSKEQGLSLGAEDVLLCAGAAGGLNAFFRAVLDPGDEVLTFAPYFVEYGFYAANHGASLKAVSSIAESFAPNLEALKKAIGPKTRLLLINSPHNPTGAVYSREDLQSIAKILEEKSCEYGRPIWLLADEPYRFLAYDGVEVPSVLGLYPYSAAVGSLSKSMSLPGERVGWIVLSPALPDKERVMAALTLTNRILGFVNPPVVGQQILARAMGSNVDKGVYERRRKAMAEVLEAGGYAFPMPKGAFYFFPQVPGGGDDLAFVQDLLSERILAVPGTGFGWPGHFRLAFCVDESTIRNAAPGFKRAAERFREKGGKK